mgnify:CR=1 FL=1
MIKDEFKALNLEANLDITKPEIVAEEASIEATEVIKEIKVYSGHVNLYTVIPMLVDSNSEQMELLNKLRNKFRDTKVFERDLELELKRNYNTHYVEYNKISKILR